MAEPQERPLASRSPALASALVMLVISGTVGLELYWRQRRQRGRRGTVLSLWTCGSSHHTCRSASLHCVAGVGVEGDRSSSDVAHGRYDGVPDPGQQLTLIAAEGMERLEREFGFDIGPQNCRRNVITRGVALQDFVGWQLRIGKEVRLFAHRPSLPCMHLESVLGQKGLAEALYYDAGLCCEILTSGMISEGDSVQVVEGTFEPARCRTWPCKALFVRGSERSKAQRSEVLAYRRGLEEAAAAGGPAERRALRLFDQDFGRRDDTWSGGRPQV